MMHNPRLAIAIPTYNRSEILRENLRTMLPELIEHRVSVHISDDSTDNLTGRMVEEFRQDFPLLFYRKNDPRCGHDDNFFATLAMPDTDHVWYLGDSVYFTQGTLARVLQALEETGPDFCFVNAYAKEQGSRIVEGPAVRAFLQDRAWFLTLSGATIYGPAPRALQISGARKAEWRNFPQLGLILEACARTPRRVQWLGAPALRFNRKKSSYWLNSAFNVFVKDWSALIRSFPSLFTAAEQDRIIRSHAQNTRLFGPLSLIQLRALGALTPDELQRHRHDFAIASPIAPMWAQLVARLPRPAVAAAWSLGVAARNRLRQGNA